MFFLYDIISSYILNNSKFFISCTLDLTNSHLYKEQKQSTMQIMLSTKQNVIV